MVNNPKFVILHCSDSPDFPQGDPSFDSIGQKQINDWHVCRGFSCIGYHWVVRQSGVLEPGRPEKNVGAHCGGHNVDSLGVCLVGRGNFTPEQKHALKALFVDLFARYGINSDKWFGHYEFTTFKTCPNVKIEVVRQWLTT